MTDKECRQILLDAVKKVREAGYSVSYHLPAMRLATGVSVHGMGIGIGEIIRTDALIVKKDWPHDFYDDHGRLMNDHVAIVKRQLENEEFYENCGHGSD